MTFNMSNKLLSMDPAFANTKGAIRGTVSVVFSFFAISLVMKAFQQPPTIAFFGVIIALMGSMAVNDPTRRQQMVTMALLPIPSCIALGGSLFLGQWPPLRIAGFLGIVFLAVWMRKFGPRWIGFGLTMFMAFFAPLFFQIHLEAILWVVAAVIISTAISFVIRFFIFPDRLSNQLSLYLKTMEIQASEVLNLIAKELRTTATEQGRSPTLTEEARLRIRKAILRFNDLNLQLDQFIGTNASKTPSELLQLQVAEQGIALNQFIEEVRAFSVVANLSSEDYLKAAELTEQLRETAFNRDKETAAKPLLHLTCTNVYVVNLDAAANRFVDSFHRPLWTEETLTNVATDIETNASTIPSAVISRERGFSVNAKQALQAALATGIASAVGVQLSQDRWYWASLAAFTVFVGSTRGETVARAFLRSLGTAGGLICGFALAYLFSGHHSLEWSLIVASIFFALFGARMAFGFWTASAFTMMLALLFDIMGTLTTHILMLRLEETLIGCAIGAVVSTVVFPTSTSAQIRAGVAKVVLLAGQSLQSWVQLSPNLFSRRTLIKQLRQLDIELKNLRLTAAPIIGNANPLNRGQVPAVLQDTSFLRHYLNHLVSAREGVNETQAQSLHAEAKELALRMQRFAAELESKARVTGTSAAVPPAVPLNDLQTEPSHWLGRIRQVLTSLESREL